MKNTCFHKTLGWILLAACLHPAFTNAQAVKDALPADARSPVRPVLSLAGIWNFSLDPLDMGVSTPVDLAPQKLDGKITLPGSTDQAGMGLRNRGMTSLRLTRLFEYQGPAWYEKEAYVPDTWKDKEIYLYLERAHWKTEVWVNGTAAGERESLSTPHRYDITALVHPGEKNDIRIKVNNDHIYDIGYTHALSAETQTNWNGIIGKIQLQAFDKVHIKDVQVYPELKDKRIRVEITIANDTKEPVQGTLSLAIDDAGKGSSQTTSAQVTFSGKDSLISLSTRLSMGPNVRLWDEFHPNLYELRTCINAMSAVAHYADSSTVSFGMRAFTTRGTQFYINGHPTFIRADVNSAESPITGYPSTGLPHWLHVFKTCREYGLNAMRFHSWCPPEAAFEAADRLGFYLQVENSDWRFTVGKDPATNRFLTEEATRILRTYGNHPSFTMFCEGNELVGPTVKSFLSGLVASWKKEDPRHLYTGSSGYPVVPGDQYADYYGPRAQHWKEGLKGRFNTQSLTTDFDYASYVTKFGMPLISHEVGQWCMYPDFSQIPKYTGVLKPYNYELFRESLRDHHMLGQAHLFTMASGKFQVIQKKEEIEALLRTPGLGGYQLLELQDFPGQGTAPVGVVDVFWDPKPYVTAKEFREFQSAYVPLLRTPSVIYTNDQVFKAMAGFANYGDSTLRQAVMHWSLQYPDGSLYAAGDLPGTDIPAGGPFQLGRLLVPLNRISEATRLDLRLSIKGTPYTNHWSIWVYPENLPVVDMGKVLIAHEWNDRVKETLEKGGKVLLLADTSKIAASVPPGFSGISWNAVWSGGVPPNMLGTLCDPAHPALKSFPTQYYSNWQWWDLVRHSSPMILNIMPVSLQPLVQMIPDWNKNNKLGLVFEAKVGNGKLLMTSIDLMHDMDNRPVARQLLFSLERYVSGNRFDPQAEVPAATMEQLFKK